MIDLSNEKPISLTAAARMLPPGRRGRPVSLSCIFRWIVDGIRLPTGEVLRLEGSRCGGRWLTSVEAVQRFMDRQTPRFEDQPTPLPSTLRRRQRASERAAQELGKVGI
jgi:hypothetical protein